MVESVLGSDGSRVTVRQVQRGMNIVEASTRVAASGADVLVAAGGDGTINAAASALIYHATALGVIPAGTLNHFARDLHIPLGPEEAAQSLVDGQTIQVDAATVNGRVFINNSVLGLFPKYRSVREAWDRHGFGSSRLGRFIAIVAAVWRVFWRLPHLAVSMTINGRQHKLRTPFVLVGNNEHEMEGFAFGRRRHLDKGMLWVYSMRPCTRWKLLRLIVGLVFGHAPRESIFHVFRTPQVTIDSKRRRIGVGIDGEMVRMKAPLHFESLPGARKVIAPSSYSAIE